MRTFGYELTRDTTDFCHEDGGRRIFATYLFVGIEEMTPRLESLITKIAEVIVDAESETRRPRGIVVG